MRSYRPDRDEDIVSTNHIQDWDHNQKSQLVLNGLMHGNAPSKEQACKHSFLVVLAD